MDEEEFDEFYAASYRRVVGQVYAMIGDRDEAQECVQEAYARAWAHRRKLARTAHPEAWVRTTAHRLAISRWRRVVHSRTRHRVPDRAVGAPIVQSALDETHVAVVAALRRLPEVQRRAIVLHHFGDLSVSQIAQETDAPEGTVKARLSRGRKALATLLADSTDHPGQTPSDAPEGAHHG